MALREHLIKNNNNTINMPTQFKFGNKTIVTSKITHYQIDELLYTIEGEPAQSIKFYIENASFFMQYHSTFDTITFYSDSNKSNNCEEYKMVKKILENLK